MPVNVISVTPYENGLGTEPYINKMKKLEEHEMQENNKEKKERDEDLGYKDVFVTFAENTTAHGFAQVVLAGNIFTRLVWVIIMLSGFTILCTQIQPLVIKFMDKPTSTKLKIIQERNPNFPVVIICNENQMRKDKVYLLDTTGDEPINHKLATRLEDPTVVGHRRNDTIIQCSYNDDIDCNVDNLWSEFWHWKYGICNVFNFAYNEDGTARKIEKAIRVGSDSGMKMDIDIQQQLYDTGTPSAGIRLFVGDQGSYYSVYTHSYALAPGFSHYAQIKKSVIKRSDPFSNGSCIKHNLIEIASFGKKYQKYVDKHSLQFCSDLCLSNEVVRRCDCYDYHLPVKSKHGVGICNSTEERKCSKRARLDWQNGENECATDCTPACEEIIYELVISSQQYPTVAVRKQTVVNPGQPEPGDNYLKLFIYFRDLYYTETSEQQFYHTEQLLGDIGGQMGLFNGFSFLTVFEFFFLVIYLVGFSIFRLLSKKRDTQVKP